MAFFNRAQTLVAAGAVVVALALGACSSTPSDVAVGEDTTGNSAVEEVSSGDAAPITTTTTEPPTDTTPPTADTTQEAMAMDAMRVAAAPASGNIRDVDFANLESLPSYHDTDLAFGPFVDGEFFNGDWGDPNFSAYFIDDPVFADVNGDGVDEAVASGAWNGGGSGFFSELRAFAIDGDDVVEIAVMHYGDRAFGGIAEVTTAPDGQAVLVDVFIDGDGACCAHTVVRERVDVVDGEFSAREELGPIRYAELATESPDRELAELTFLPGTSEAMLGLWPSDRGAIRFDARAGQLISLIQFHGRDIDAMWLTHVESEAVSYTHLTLPTIYSV